MNAAPASVPGPGPIQFGFTPHDVVLCAMPVGVLVASILSLL